MQASFMKRVVPQILFILLFLLELLIAGRLMLVDVFRIRSQRILVETMMSVGLGISVWIVFLWILAVLGWITPIAGWFLSIAIPIIGLRHSREWIRRFFSASWEVERQWHSLSVLLGFPSIAKPL